MTLEQIKDEVAEDFFTAKWKELDLYQQGSCFDEIAKRYATACVKASQEKIAKNASAYISYGGCNYEGEKEPYATIDKESILSPDNIALL